MCIRDRHWAVLLYLRVKFCIVLDCIADIPVELVVRLLVMLEQNLHQHVPQFLVVRRVRKPVTKAFLHKGNKSNSLFRVRQLLWLESIFGPAQSNEFIFFEVFCFCAAPATATVRAGGGLGFHYYIVYLVLLLEELQVTVNEIKEHVAQTHLIIAPALCE